MPAGSKQQGCVISDSLQTVLGWHVLPQVSVHDLARLACSCRTLRDTAYQSDQAWRSAAIAHLPAAMRFQLQTSDRVGVQHVLQRRATATRNLMKGKSMSTAVFQLTPEQVCPMDTQLAFSADGNLLAYLVSQQIAVFDAATGDMSGASTFGNCLLHWAYIITCMASL